jgi:hypothetical protein
MPMRVYIIIQLLLTSTLLTFAQDKAKCMKEIKRQFKTDSITKYMGRIDISKNTFKYSNGVIIVENTSPEMLLIFSKGLISPGHFGTSSISDTVSISYVEEIKRQQKKNKKQFSFLLYRKGIMNPSLFLFELNNDSANKKSFIQFIEKARLSAFGFCSILI